MNPPQLSLALIPKRRPRMHHTRIIRQQDIPPLPSKPQAHPPIIHQAIHHPHNPLLVVLDAHLGRGILGLAFRPALVPAQARDARDRVRDHEGHVLHLAAPVADAVEAPPDGLQARERVWGWEVLEEEAGLGEKGEARALGRRGDGRKHLDSAQLERQYWGLHFVEFVGRRCCVAHLGGICTCTSSPCSSFNALPCSSFLVVNLKMPS